MMEHGPKQGAQTSMYSLYFVVLLVIINHPLKISHNFQYKTKLLKTEYHKIHQVTSEHYMAT